MADTESRFTVSVDAKGLDQTKKKLEDLEGVGASAGMGAAKGFAVASANIDKMAASVDKLVTRMERLAKTVSRVTHVTGGGGGGSRIPDGTQVIGRSHGGIIGGVPQATPYGLGPPPAAYQTSYLDDKNYQIYQQMMQDHAESKKPQPWKMPGGMKNFGLGMFQSALPNTMGFLQRGPGALSQGLGLMAGRALGGIASIPFAGVSALTSAAGMFGAPLSKYMGRAENAMSMQRQQLEMAPLLGSAGIGSVSPEDAAYAAIHGTKPRGGAMTTQQLQAVIPAKGYAALNLMGANVQQGQSFSTQLAQAGGNRVDQMSPQFVMAAMAAKTTMGADAGTTGAFALAARTNAVAGAGGKDSAALLNQALDQIQSLGLTGSDAQNYLQQIAEGIHQFQVSGMPLQMSAMRDLSAGFTGMGMAPLQAQRAAQGMIGASQNFRETGPVSGADLRMMQKAGFIGGIDSMLSTKRKLGTDAGLYSKNAVSVASEMALGGSSDVARESVRDYLKGKGIADERVTDSFVAAVRGGEKDPNKAFEAAQRAVQGNPGMAPEQRMAQAQNMLPTSVTNVAAAQNKDFAMGSDAVALAQQLDQTANSAADIMSNFGGLLKGMSAIASKLVGSISGGGADKFAADAGVRAAN